MIKRWASLLFLSIFIQRCTPTRYRLIYHSNERVYQVDTIEYQSVRFKKNQGSVTTVSGQKQPLEAKKLWGYQDVEGANYRIYKDEVYEVIQEKTITIYRQSKYGDGFNDDYYFSISPTDEVLYLNIGNLKKAFKDQPCMVEMLQQKPLRHWFKTDGTGTFLLIDAFHYCQQQTHENPLAHH